MRYLIFALILLSTLFAQANELKLLPTFAQSQPSHLKLKAEFICHTILNRVPFIYTDHFSQRFTSAIPESYFLDEIKSAVDATGKCKSNIEMEEKNTEATYKFVSKNSRSISIKFSIDDRGLIDGFSLREVLFPDVEIKNWNDANNHLLNWEGHPSVTIANLTSGVDQSYKGDFPQPLGSGFKLYVLGTLASKVESGELKWDDEFPIKDAWKSLPSGIMHTWQEGKLVSLKTFADHMISISDNTATDHLINILGREKVENQTPKMGNSFPFVNRPFLKTYEMFKLKWAAPASTIESYIHGKTADKRSLLKNNISKLSLRQVGTNGVPMSKPAFINDIEWFGSTNDLCRAMGYLKNLNSNEILDSLSKNTPFVKVGGNSKWDYAGFKGGSEPGVLTMTYLLKNRNTNWKCVSLAWHNETQNINRWIFLDFAAKVLKLAE